MQKVCENAESTRKSLQYRLNGVRVVHVNS